MPLNSLLHKTSPSFNVSTPLPSPLHRGAAAASYAALLPSTCVLTSSSPGVSISGGGSPDRRGVRRRRGRAALGGGAGVDSCSTHRRVATERGWLSPRWRTYISLAREKSGRASFGLPRVARRPATLLREDATLISSFKGRRERRGWGGMGLCDFHRAIWGRMLRNILFGWYVCSFIMFINQ